MFEIYSEINQLRSVILHRPGIEINNLTPAFLSQYLFEDIPFLSKAQEEHDELRKVLEANGVNVYLVTELLVDIFNKKNEYRNDFLDKFLSLSNVFDFDYRSSLKDFFMSLPIQDFVEKVISGVKITDLHPKSKMIDSNFYSSQLFIIPPMPNLLYQRDPSFVIGGLLNLSTLSNSVRKRETFILETIFTHHDLFEKANLHNRIHKTNSFSIEGGDVQVISQEVALIGVSKRSEPLAIKLLAKKIFLETTIKKIYAIEIPKDRAFMHLDTVFTQVDHFKFVYHSEIFKNVQIYKLELIDKEVKINHISETLEKLLNRISKSINQFIPCGGEDFITRSREQWNDGANTFAIKPGKVITYDRNIMTNELLSHHGVEIIPIKASELSRGRGGPHCLTLPLKRY